MAEHGFNGSRGIHGGAVLPNRLAVSFCLRESCCEFFGPLRRGTLSQPAGRCVSPRDLVFAGLFRCMFKMLTCLFGLSARRREHPKKILRSGGAQHWGQAITSKWQTGHLGAKRARFSYCRFAISAPLEGKRLLQQHLDPDLPDIRAALLTREKAIVKQAFGTLEITCFGAV